MDGDGWAALSIGLYSLVGIAVVICIFTIPITIGKLINPEYYAVEKILDAVKGKQ